MENNLQITIRLINQCISGGKNFHPFNNDSYHLIQRATCTHTAEWTEQDSKSSLTFSKWLFSLVLFY